MLNLLYILLLQGNPRNTIQCAIYRTDLMWAQQAEDAETVRSQWGSGSRPGFPSGLTCDPEQSP